MISRYPLVSIVTINYNQAPVTKEFLRSIRQISYPNYEVIVVDNASQHTGFDELMDEFTWANFIQSPQNLGFAGGNNLGMQLAKGHYVLFINNDTEVEKGFLEPLVTCMQQSPSIGMVSPKIKYFYQPNLIQYAGGTHINPYTGRGAFTGYKLEDCGQFNQSQATQLIHGAAMLVSREMIEEIGPMDDAFFLYYEELDWCERAKRAGFELYYVADSTVYHKESMSVGKNSPLKMYYQTRNRLLFMRRNFSGYKLWISTLFFALFSVPKAILMLTLSGQFRLLHAFSRAIAWHIRSLFTRVPNCQPDLQMVPQQIHL